MRRVLILAVFLASLMCFAPAHAENRALLVGIDQYPFLAAADRLNGATNDLRRMRLVLKTGRYQVTELAQTAATGAAIRDQLAQLSQHARNGDRILFYFSGRGSVAYDPRQPRRTEELEPTLVPVDGHADDAAADVPLQVLEEWARQIQARGATPLLFLDTCYTQLDDRGDDRFYRTTPRCIARRGLPRKQLYTGPGVFLGATEARGRAYEWRTDLDTNTWIGAFTDYFTCALARRVQRKENPSYAVVMDDVRTFFASKPGYMSGFRPYTSPDALAGDGYRTQSVFGLTPSPEAVKSPAVPPAPELKIIAQAQEQRESTLRIGIDSGPSRTPPGAPAELTRFTADLDRESRRLEYLTVVPPQGDRPDRLLTLRQIGSEWEVEITGSLVDASRQPRFRGRTVAELMADGLADYLQRQAYVARLFFLTRPEVTPTLTTAWTAATKAPRYHPGDATFAYALTIPEDGSLYLLEKDSSDGVVNLVWPAPEDWDNRFKPGSATVPRQGRFAIPRNQPVPTRTQVRAIFVRAERRSKLPSLAPRRGTVWAEGDRGAYSRAERDHLKDLVRALTNHQLRWSARTFAYTIE
jgi:hypothetical protein